MSTLASFYAAVGVNNCMHKSKSRLRYPGCLMESFGNRRIRSNTLFFIRTYNFVVEAERFFFLFAEFELENVLNVMNYTKFDYKLSGSSMYHLINTLLMLRKTSLSI